MSVDYKERKIEREIISIVERENSRSEWMWEDDQVRHLIGYAVKLARGRVLPMTRVRIPYIVYGAQKKLDAYGDGGDVK